MIRFENVSKTYKGDVVALREVTLDIAKGEFVFLVGPSGSGKSTLLKLLLRDEVATDGKVLVAGRDIGRLGAWKVPQLRRNIGCVFQDYKLLTNKTVYENVAFALEVIGRPKHIIRTQVPQILDLVGLTKKSDNFPTELSGGEQQRVSIARAFVNRPLILLADEPTGNLDPATTVGIMRLLDRINRTGTTVVMATHDQRIVDAMRRRDGARSRLARARPGARRLRRRFLMSRLAYFTRETLISLRRNLLMTFAGVMTVSVSLFLFGGILLVSRVVDHGTSKWKHGVELEIFMQVKASQSQIDAVKASARRRGRRHGRRR